MIYRTLTQQDITRSLFAYFRRHQTVGKCWRKAEDGSWIIKDDPFIDDWSEEDYQFLVACLKHTIATGGIVILSLIHISILCIKIPIASFPPNKRILQKIPT